MIRPSLRDRAYLSFTVGGWWVLLGAVGVAAASRDVGGLVTGALTGYLAALLNTRRINVARVGDELHVQNMVVSKRLVIGPNDWLDHQDLGGRFASTFAVWVTEDRKRTSLHAVRLGLDNALARERLHAAAAALDVRARD